MINLFRLVTFANPLPPPFLLIGSQLGSLNSIAYSRSHPQQVAHVVLIDPVTQSIFEENSKNSKVGSDNQQVSWKHFWLKKQIPFSRLLQVTALLGINRIAILLGYMSVPGVSHDITENDANNEKEKMETNDTLEDDYKMIAKMRLNHFMTDSTNLGVAAAELGN